MLLELTEIKHIFYNFLSEEILREEKSSNEDTVTVKIPYDPDITQISTTPQRSYVPFKDAPRRIEKVSPERRDYILANLEDINPLPGGDLTDDERVFYVLTKADMITRDLEKKLADRKKKETERRERENLAHIERIKQRYSKGGKVEKTAVIGDRSSYVPDYDDTISMPFLDIDDTI